MAARKKAPKASKPAPAARRPAPPAAVGEGDLAPRFQVPDHEGRPVASDTLAGRPYVLYFYPKADTPGCTTESCGFRDAAKAFARAGVEILGASPDAPKAQARFRQKHDLPFPLLADQDHALAEAYGVWKEKSMYGRTYLGIERSTFLVDAGGRIAKAWRGVKVPGHVAEVLAAAEQVGGKPRRC